MLKCIALAGLLASGLIGPASAADFLAGPAKAPFLWGAVAVNYHCNDATDWALSGALQIDGRPQGSIPDTTGHVVERGSSSPDCALV